MGGAKRSVSFYIGIGQLDKELDDEPICDRLDAYYNELSKKLNTHDLGGWRLNLLIVLRSTNAIGIPKRVTRYPSDKEAVASLVIPIPGPEDAKYGSRSAVDPKYSRYAPIDEKNFHALDPDYARFQSLGEYVLESAKRAIDEVLRLGLSVNGKKIKLQV